MGGFQVQPGDLAGAATGHESLAGELLSLAARLEGIGADAAGSAGDPGATEAIARNALAWSGSVKALAASLSGTGANLGAAGSAYSVTDGGAMPGGG